MKRMIDNSKKLVRLLEKLIKDTFEFVIFSRINFEMIMTKYILLYFRMIKEERT